MLRPPAAIALAAVAFLAIAARPAAADVAQVTVVTPGGKQHSLALAALAGGEDVVARSYVVRSGEGESPVTITGFSLAALLAAADVDTFGFSYLEVQRPAGGAVLLSREQALGEGVFADGPPVVYATASGTGFLRPAAAADDLNAADSFEAPQGVGLVMRKDSPLRVRARASTSRTEVGERVDFEAVVERSGSGERLSYSWYFDDGQSASGARTSHVFRQKGSYDVVLGVTTTGDEVGTSAVVTVQVGEPLAGPDRKGGGRNGDADAPDHGAATGAAGSGSGGGSGGAAPASAAPGDATRAQPGSGAAAQREAAARRRAAQRRAAERRAERQRQRRVAARRDAGERVSGELIDASAGSAPQQQPRVCARSGRLDGDRHGGGVPGTALGVLATLGLLGLGALGEAGRLGHLRGPHSGSGA